MVIEEKESLCYINNRLRYISTPIEGNYEGNLVGEHGSHDSGTTSMCRGEALTEAGSFLH